MEGKLRANLIIEILGRPAEHVKESLNTIIVKLGSENGTKLINKTYHDPVPAKDSKTLFSAFAEAEVEFDSIDHYFLTLFSYMPSHIEIIYPEKFTMTNNDLNTLGNHILQRIHNYDSIAKNLVAERTIILQQIQKEAPEVFKKLVQPPKQEPQKKEGKKSSKDKKKKSRKK